MCLGNVSWKSWKRESLNKQYCYLSNIGSAGTYSTPDDWGAPGSSYFRGKQFKSAYGKRSGTLSRRLCSSLCSLRSTARNCLSSAASFPLWTMPLSKMESLHHLRDQEIAKLGRQRHELHGLVAWRVRAPAPLSTEKEPGAAEPEPIEINWVSELIRLLALLHGGIGLRGP